jgi:hypothetical protein
MQAYLWYRILRLVHIYAAIVLVGAIVFNTVILMPALRRIPPAHSAVISQKIGGGLMALGGSAIVLLGVTGFLRLWLLGVLPAVLSFKMIALVRLRWIFLMLFCWLGILVTGTLSAVWYKRVLTKRLPYSAGLRELEQRRAAQEKVAKWQDRLAYLNLALALAAALGGILASF